MLENVGAVKKREREHNFNELSFIKYAQKSINSVSKKIKYNIIINQKDGLYSISI